MSRTGINRRILSYCIAFSFLLTLVLTTCNPLSGADVLQGSDTVDPVIIISSPADGDPYSTTVTVTGMVSDEADDNGSEGRVESLSWELTGTILGGEVSPEADGNFSFDVTTTGLTGTLTLKLTATDWNDNSATETLALVAPKSITSFVFLVEDNASAGLSEDAVGLIDGTDITVSVPDGTDVQVLVATFESTGVEVKVGTTEQVSGETDNDFTDPVVYTVEANDTTVKNYTVTVTATPLQPTDLASAVGAGTVTLTWTDNASNETGYTVERMGSTESDYTPVGQYEAGTTEITDTSFSGSSVYQYRVRADNDAGSSAWASLEVNVQPAAPTSLAVDGDITATTINLLWTDNATTATAYRVERKAGTGDYTVLDDSLEADATGYSDSTFSGSGSSLYTYRVTAGNNGGWSEPAVLPVDVTPTEPVIQSVEVLSSSSIQITWDDTSTNETGFRIQRKGGPDADFVTVDENATSPHIDTNLTGWTLYTYVVRAYNDDAVSNPSNEGNGRTLLFTSGSDITNLADVVGSIHAADLDGDGDPDILASYGFSNSNIVWYENLLDETGVFSIEIMILDGINGVNDVYAADLDGDGDNDVLSASGSDDKIIWYENDGTGGFSTGTDISTSADGATSVYAADLDGDGDKDVISTTASDNRVNWYENRLDDFPADFTTGTMIANVMAARSGYATDLDGNGDNDVLAVSPTADQVRWFDNDGTGVFSVDNYITLSAYGAQSVYAADLDGDGDEDVLSASSSDKRIVWYENRLNEATVDFSSGTDISTSAAGAAVVFAADLDGDGDIDVLSASSYDDRVVWYANDGSGVFSSGTDITSSADNVIDVYAADLDGDGDLDVLSASRADDRITWYENLLSN